MVDLWQTDPFRHPDPYQELTPEYALKDIKAELALEEGHQLSIGGMDFTHILSESQFLIKGLELEDAQ
jgi:hypothetical protein